MPRIVQEMTGGQVRISRRPAKVSARALDANSRAGHFQSKVNHLLANLILFSRQRRWLSRLRYADSGFLGDEQGSREPRGFGFLLAFPVARARIDRRPRWMQQKGMREFVCDVARLPPPTVCVVVDNTRLLPRNTVAAENAAFANPVNRRNACGASRARELNEIRGIRRCSASFQGSSGALGARPSSTLISKAISFASFLKPRRSDTELGCP